MKFPFQARTLLLVLLLLLAIGGLAVASLNGVFKGDRVANQAGKSARAAAPAPGDGLACPQGAKCYTPATLGGRSVWQESGFTAAAFEKAYLIAPSYIFDVVKVPIKVGFWDRSMMSWSLDYIPPNPTVFTYLPGESPGPAADYWPVDLKTVGDTLAKIDSFVAIGEVKGKPRLLLAARDRARLQRLASCAMNGACPELHRASVSPWQAVAGTLPEWADFAFTVDLRNPADDGTAIVYAEGRNGRFSFGGGSEWSDSPTNLRATFSPEDGRLMAEMPDYHRALTLDPNGRLVYEVQPTFIPPGSGVRSRILSGGAYLSMAHLLPDVRQLGGKQVALRWLLPDGWSVSAPWEKTGDWYAPVPSELLQQYISAGPLSYQNFTAGQTSFTIGLLSSMDPAKRTAWNGRIEKAIRLLVERFGEPPTDQRPDFRLTIFDAGLTDGGSAGARTAITTANERVTLHETIHWWVGIRSRDDIPAWHESMTDYLATRTILDLGDASEADFKDWFVEKPSYERMTQGKDHWTPLFFQRDLDRLIREQSAGRSSLFDVVRYYHATPKYQGAGSLDRAGLILLVKEATGVDPRSYFDQRY